MKVIPNTLKSKKIRLKGLFTSIPYEIRNASGDWSGYFGTYEGQKHDDLDSNCCWSFAGNEVLEDQLTFLWKTNQFTEDDIAWFKANGYIDQDGDFYLSRRFIPILSGVKRNGNDQEEFWRLINIYGAIPNSLLPYTNNVDYFDKAFVTDEMYSLGKQFLDRVYIQYNELGTRFKGYTLDQLKTAQKQSPLQIGIPVPQDGTWNQVRVKWNSTKNPQHDVELYDIDETRDYNFPIFIYDQYQPFLKQLSRDYFIPLTTLAVVKPNRLSPKLTISVWVQFINLLRKMGVL